MRLPDNSPAGVFLTHNSLFITGESPTCELSIHPSSYILETFFKGLKLSQ